MSIPQKPRMQLQCPMPEMDFERITLGHGGGGLLTHKLLSAGVFTVLGNPLLNRAHDGAFLNLEGPTAFSTDSFIVSPIFFPGGNIGELAVNGTVNDLAMCGAIPRYLSLSFILEEGLLMAEFWEVITRVKAACDLAGVVVVTGDTKVVEKGKGDKIFINTSGLGSLHPKAAIGAENIAVGDKIVLSGPIASHGMAIMSVREGLNFESEIKSDTACLNHSVIRMVEAFGNALHLVTDPTRGGVATVLNELAQRIGLGMSIIQEAIPVLPQVAGACELLGLDPLYVANEGVFLSFVASEIAEDFVRELQHDPHGRQASIIGTVVKNHPKKVVLESGIGGKRIVSMLPGEQLPRIC